MLRSEGRNALKAPGNHGLSLYPIKLPSVLRVTVVSFVDLISNG